MTTARQFAILAMLVLTFVLVPVVAQASPVIITINDLNEGVVMGTAIGFDPNSLLIQSGIEAWELHGEYTSIAPPPVGVPVVVNINFLEPYQDGNIPPGGLSDSLSIVLIGVTPFPGSLCNVSVDLHFRSDPYATTLPNAFNIYENGTFQDVSNYVVANGGPTDFTILVASDVPEPSSLLLMASGALGLAGVLRRKLGR